MAEPAAVAPTGVVGASGRRFWAFISYSQRDTATAIRLHEFLETFRLPRRLVGLERDGRRIPDRLAPVFRDRDELAGSPDLGAALERALTASEALVVLCSPASARSVWVDREVLTFKRMGRGSRLFALVIADPEDGVALDEGCFPPSLRWEIGPDGERTGRRSEPLAADARPGQDGWRDACLKLVAGILGLDYDDLRRREEVRDRRRKLLQGGKLLVTAAAAVAAYVGLADAGLEVAGADAIRTGLDRRHWTLFRPVQDAAVVVGVAAAARTKLRTRLVRAIDDGSVAGDPELSTWMAGQVASAILADPAATAADVGSAVSIVRLPGAALGPAIGGGDPPRAEHVFWTVIALASALGRRELTDPDIRRSFEQQLVEAQARADAYRPLPDGGWNVVPGQANPRAHYVYTTGLALHMLLAVRAAGAGWHGDRARLDRLIATTVDWLAGTFVDQPVGAGWRRSLGDDRPPDSGITLLIFSALGRVCADLETPLPANVQDAALASQFAQGRRAYDAADPDIRFDVQSKDASGRTWGVTTVTRMIWYPWAAEGVAHWRTCAARQRLAPEVLRRLDRSLGHLLVDLSPDMLRDVTASARQLFVVAETQYGLDRAP